MGFSQASIAWFRDVARVVEPGEISLNVNEIEAMMHEFRLVKTQIDEITDRLQTVEITDTKPEEDLDQDDLMLPPVRPQELALTQGTFTDNKILRADGTTGIQDSDPSITDDGDVIVNQEVIEQNREITRYALMVSS
jgi:hypothetical protein